MPIGLMATIRGGGAVGRRVLPCAAQAAPTAQGALGALGSRRVASSDTLGAAGEALEDARVLEHLVCPISKFPLRYDRERACLVCDEINVTYPVRNGVPVLIPAEGRIISAD